MSDLLKKPPAGEIVAENVSVEDFLANYTGTETRYEWVEGFVIQMSPTTEQHNFLVDYFHDIFRAYFRRNPIGKSKSHTFMIRFKKSFRIPDVFVVLHSNPNKLTNTMMEGAPDICVEVVSDESKRRDHNEKKAEYESLGVHEYWIIDIFTQQAIFYRLQENGVYAQVLPDANDNYTTPLLPKLKIHVPTLWQDELPAMDEVFEIVKAMLAEEE